jgi:hypothetical protein
VALIERIRTADGGIVALTREAICIASMESHGDNLDRIESLVRRDASFHLSLAEQGVRIAYGIVNMLPVLEEYVVPGPLAVYVVQARSE